MLRVLESKGSKRPQISAGRRGVARSGEFVRVRDLPRRSLSQYDEHVAEALSERLRKKGSKAKLRAGQAAMLLDASNHDGLFSMAGVGLGKTWLAPLFGYALGSKCAIVLVPPSMKHEVERKVIPLLLRDFTFDPPTIVSYAELSSPRSADILDRIQPDLIVADECHMLRHKTAARTKRFLRYLKENPQCRVIAMSGTIMRRSVRDLHLLYLTHRGGTAPVTRQFKELEEWADALDPGVSDYARISPGALLELCRPGESARDGFRRRLIETEGVFGGSSEEVGASILFQKCHISVPPVVETALATLRKDWALPGGELIVDALDFYRRARELAQGFYYVWDWPNGGVDFEWMAARAAWRAAVASVTRLSRPGLDSELLVRNATAREVKAKTGELPKTSREGVIDAWLAWEAVHDRPEPPVRAVWLHDFLVQAAVTWANGHIEAGEGGLMWFESRAFEEKLSQQTLTSGQEIFGAGADGNRRLSAVSDLPPEKPIVAFCSMSHAIGKNLQRWSRNLIVTPPSGGATWEQLVGRTHRPGQLADEVFVDYFAHTIELAAAIDTARDQSRAIEDIQGSKQKICLGTWLAN